MLDIFSLEENPTHLSGYNITVSVIWMNFLPTFLLCSLYCATKKRMFCFLVVKLHIVIQDIWENHVCQDMSMVNFTRDKKWRTNELFYKMAFCILSSWPLHVRSRLCESLIRLYLCFLLKEIIMWTAVYSRSTRRNWYNKQQEKNTTPVGYELHPSHIFKIFSNCSAYICCTFLLPFHYVNDVYV